MNQSPRSQIAADCNPVFSMAGVMPGGSEMAWKTAYPNPDAAFAPARAAGHGPSFSVAGVMPGTSQTAWHTAMPDPTRDMLDSHGYVVAISEFTALAELAAQTALLALPAAGGPVITARFPRKTR